MFKVTAEDARKVWRYDPDNGQFYWLISPKYDVVIGSIAGCFDGRYWRIQFKGKTYRASRLAWLYMIGEWPKNHIDHIDGNPKNNAFCNLREATNSENGRNRGAQKNNKLGIKGIHKRENGRFVARLMVNGQYVLNKYFETAEEAKAAYNDIAKKRHGSYAHL